MFQQLHSTGPAMIIRPHPSGDWEVVDDHDVFGVLSSLDLALEASLQWIRGGGRIELQLSPMEPAPLQKPA